MSDSKRAAIERRGWTERQRAKGMSLCWEWNGTVMRNGYAYIHADNKLYRAHRASYEVFVGPIPAGAVVRHLCNNRCCIRPDHLAAGTQRQNLADMKSAKRSANGERNARAVLSDEEVDGIRDTYRRGGVTYRALGQRYGVDASTIGLIIRRRKRQHPTFPMEQAS